MADIKWRPVSEKPETRKSATGWIENTEPILVWVEDSGRNYPVQAASTGRYIGMGEYANFAADGFTGGFRITHWAYINRPKES